MLPLRVKIIQSLGELLIPLLGYFFWNWNFYFIALFYLLDAVAGSGFLFVKLKKMQAAQSNAKINYSLHVFLLIALYGGIICLGLGMMPKLDPAFDVQAESLRFILLEDMGLPQGIFLVPLVVYGAYLQYKMSFLLPKTYQKQQPKQVYTAHYTGLLFALGCMGISFALLQWMIFPPLVAVISLVILMTAYSFLMKK